MVEHYRSAQSILRRPDVERETGLSRSTIYRRMRMGRFPQPVMLGGRLVGWRVEDVQAFLADPARYRSRPPTKITGEQGGGHAVE